MTIAKTILAASVALCLAGSATFAQQAMTGTVTKVDRINGVVAIQPTQGGTVGANTAGATEQFKTQSGLSLEPVHAGDKVTLSVTDIGGTRTITKIDKQ